MRIMRKLYLRKKKNRNMKESRGIVNGSYVTPTLYIFHFFHLFYFSRKKKAISHKQLMLFFYPIHLKIKCNEYLN